MLVFSLCHVDSGDWIVSFSSAFGHHRASSQVLTPGLQYARHLNALELIQWDVVVYAWEVIQRKTTTMGTTYQL